MPPSAPLDLLLLAFDPDKESDNGRLFHCLLWANHLCLPSTFADKHRGRSNTLALPNGFLLRRDFVALPIDFMTFVARSEVDDDFLLATFRVDHSAVSVLITIPCSKNFDVSRPSRFAFNRKALKDPESVALVRSHLAALPVIPWQVDATAHVSVLSLQVQTALAEAIPSVKKKPKPAWISDKAWEVKDVIKTHVRNRGTSTHVLLCSYAGFAFHV